MARRIRSRGGGVAAYDIRQGERLDYSENESYLLQTDSDSYRGDRVRRLSGTSIVRPGYRIIGSQAGAESEQVVIPRVLKVVSPLTGQGPADPRDTGRYANYDLGVVQVRRLRVARRVAPNSGFKVIRPKQTPIRRYDTAGNGIVSLY